MASMTIRNLDDDLKQRLRIRSAQHGRSMEEEARDILRSSLSEEAPLPGDLSATIRQRFAQAGYFELAPVRREAICEPPGFES